MSCLMQYRRSMCAVILSAAYWQGHFLLSWRDQRDADSYVDHGSGDTNQCACRTHARRRSHAFTDRTPDTGIDDFSHRGS